MSVIYFVALDDYNMTSIMSEGVPNKMRESLEVFSEVSSSEFFKDTVMILFLNKRDLFEEKISRIYLNVCFDDYDGPMNYKEGLKFIGSKFLSVGF